MMNKSPRKKTTKATHADCISKSEAIDKLKHLKLMLLNSVSRIHVFEIIKNAEPWLLKSILAGSSVKISQDGELKVNSGPFFKSKKTSGWGAGNSPDPSVELVFWLAAAKAYELDCCPKSITFDNVSTLFLDTKSQEEYSLAINYVLPAFNSLKYLMLSLDFYGSQFSTKDLPTMKFLSELTIFGNCEASSIKIESIEKHILLNKIRIHNFSDLDFEEINPNINKIQFYITISKLKRISSAALRNLLTMQGQHDCKMTDDRQAIQDSFDLSSLEKISSEHAKIISKTDMSFYFNLSSIDAKAIENLSVFNGKIHLNGVCHVDQFKLLKTLNCSLFFNFENEIDEDSAKSLPEFNAKMIGIQCTSICNICISSIIKYPGFLCLGGPGSGIYCDFEVNLRLAKILIMRKAPLKLQDGWRITPESMDILVTNIYLDISTYRRVFEKNDIRANSTIILEKLYTPLNDKEHLLRSTHRDSHGIVNVKNEFRSNQYNSQGISYLELAASKLIQNGWNEVISNNKSAE
jgi:hypothetical protein